MSEYLRNVVERARWYHLQPYVDVPAREALQTAARDFDRSDYE